MLPESSGHLFMPVYADAELYFYITQIGHYYCNHEYAIRRDYFSPILVLCVRAGRLHVHYRDRAYDLRAGDALLADCREPHIYYADGDGLEFYYLHFEGSNAHEICQRLLDTRGPLIDRAAAPPLSERLERMMEEYDGGKTDTEFGGSRSVYEILRYLHGDIEGSAPRASYIDAVTRYINENIDRPIALGELAQQAYLSEYHFSRRFKRDTGYSPVEYAARKKLEYAKTLLIRTEWPVSLIAEKTGYSFKGLVKLFTKHEGCPPLAWRKKMQQHVF